MPEFINPYQFIPVTLGSGNPRPDDLLTAEFDSGNLGNVTHNRFVPGTYSGRIVCRLQTRDPIVLGGEQDQSQVPPEVKPFLVAG